MDTATRLQQALDSIIAAENGCGRSPGSVQLLAVSKSFDAEQLLPAIAAGQRHFGENYVQEALAKIQTLDAYPLIWHFIGRLQSNKLRHIAKHFAWVHSICQIEHAEKLNALREDTQAPLQCCLQVNVDNDPHKAGISPQQIESFCEYFAQWPKLQLRGLMTLGLQHATDAQQQTSFAQLKTYLDAIQNLPVDTLSMGTSRDYLKAIAEGSTMVRLGTVIFGERHGK